MPKLNQIIAIEHGTKTQTQKDLTEAHHALQKPALLTGIARTYRTKDDDGDKFPDESTRVQTTAAAMLDTTARIMGALFDLVATKDWANCEAKADVVVDGVTLIAAAPVTFLLWIEDRLQDLKTFVEKIPTLDPSDAWHWDASQNCWASEPAETTKTKKLYRNHVKAEATDKHPAQVEIFTEDAVIGYWKTTKYSGALAASQAAQVLARIKKVADAVKFAREEANMREVERQHVGDAVYRFLLAPVAPSA